MSSPISKQLTAYLIIGLDTCVELAVTAVYDKNDPYAVRLVFPDAIVTAVDADADADDGGFAAMVEVTAADQPRDLDADDVLSWTFARELLGDGQREPVGEGDVHVWPCGPDLVMVELRSGIGSALLALAARDLRTFLFLSYAEVPPGYESNYLELDRLLHDLMGRA